MNGVLIIDKPSAYTSFDIVAVVRKYSGQKKIGHTGTLDPNATGVLPLLLGNAAKAQDLIPDHDKEYIAGFKLGLVSDTLDIWGNVEKRETPCICREDIVKNLFSFAGRIQQVPPMFSAVQQNGVRLYDLARKGIEVERKSRTVTVYDLQLVSFDARGQSGVLKIKCSKGTYVRTLIDDLGKKLGCGAVMSSLQRTFACGYTLKDAFSLERVKAFAEEGTLETRLLPTESLFVQYKTVTVTDAQAKRFQNGGALDLERTALSGIRTDKQLFRVCSRKNEFLGLGITDLAAKQLKIYKLF